MGIGRPESYFTIHVSLQSRCVKLSTVEYVGSMHELTVQIVMLISNTRWGGAATAGGALHGHSEKLTLFGDLEGFKSL